MRTRKQELISDELKPLVSDLMKTSREKYNYSLEDLSKAINNQKNRQTLHKYETGKLNIPYDILFEICRVFNIDSDIFSKAPITEEEKKILEKKMIKDYVSSLRKDKNLTPQIEKIINTYKNASYEAPNNKSELCMKVTDDSMYPTYLKNDKVYFQKQEDYKNGDDIIIAVKNNQLAVRRLYRYPKGIILQAMNPKYQTINVNIISNDMILGRVTSIHREFK
ncbi:MAG: LexA family transcriptional regulator [Erysipelotrichaceae bacterium]|nr:LexA family transcriptional regulator [Erysipelotrichaceae bacterium]